MEKLIARLLFITASLMTLVYTSCKPDDEDKIEKENCDTCIVAYKPNIYIYPEQQKHLVIELTFPLGGSIVVSEPIYGNGWNVMVDTNGLIDNQFRFLFYESIQPNVWQTHDGWVIEKENLEQFFRQNMASYGFTLDEITDFTEYWVPRLSDNNYYAIYPQTNALIDKVIHMEISEVPDNILRLFYLVIPVADKNITINTPLIPCEFNRRGFTIAEWGVLMP